MYIERSAEVEIEATKINKQYYIYANFAVCVI